MTAAPPKPPLKAFWHDLPREGKLLLSVVVFEFIGTGLVLPFWVVYLHEVRSFSLSTTGLVLGIQPLTGLLAVGPGGAIIDRMGARRVLVAALLFVISGEVVMAFAATVPVAALGMALSGLAFGVSWPASQTMIANVVPSAIRQRYFGVNFSLLNLGIGLGGLIGGAWLAVDQTWTFQAIYLADAVTFLPSLFLLLVPLRHIAGRPEHDHDDVATPSYREVLRLPGIPTLTLLTFLASFVAYAQLNTGMPAYARVVSEVSTQGLGIAFACNTLVIVVLQLVVLQRIEGRRRTRVMVVMALIWAFAWLLMGASGPGARHPGRDRADRRLRLGLRARRDAPAADHAGDDQRPHHRPAAGTHQRADLRRLPAADGARAPRLGVADRPPPGRFLRRAAGDRLRAGRRGGGGRARAADHACRQRDQHPARDRRPGADPGAGDSARRSLEHLFEPGVHSGP